MIFIDTNVLIDVLAPGQAWRDWSYEMIRRFGPDHPLAIDQIVMAELASGFASHGAAQAWLVKLGVETRSLDETIAFECGLAFKEYRRAHRARDAILSDFLIGGHARHLGATLLTRDDAIYRRYFPDLTLITPETHP